MGLTQVESDFPISREQLHLRLRGWLARDGDDDERIDGTKGKDNGRKKWIYVSNAGRLYRLHADSLRKGAELYIKYVDQFGGDLAWSIDPEWKKKPNVKTSYPRVVHSSLFLKAESFFMYTYPRT